MSAKYQRKHAATGPDLVVPGGPLPGLGSRPRVLIPRGPGVDLAQWLRSHRDEIDRDLIAHGALLFRAFRVTSVEEFSEISAAVGELIEYHEPATPRGQYLKNVYVSSEYPSYYSIPPHGELSYTYVWPRKALFFCKTPPATGGQTPVADARDVLRRIDAKVRDRFIDKKIMRVIQETEPRQRVG